jgi:hypothetical protein
MQASMLAWWGLRQTTTESAAPTKRRGPEGPRTLVTHYCTNTVVVTLTFTVVVTLTDGLCCFLHGRL